MKEISDNDFLVFNNVYGLKGKSKIEMNITVSEHLKIEIHENTPEGKILATYNLEKQNLRESKSFDFSATKDKLNLCFVFKGKGDDLLRFDSFSFQ